MLSSAQPANQLFLGFVVEYSSNMSITSTYASSRSIVLTALFISAFLIAFIIIYGACNSGWICVHSLHHRKFFFHRRYSSTSADLKTGTFKSFTSSPCVSSLLFSHSDQCFSHSLSSNASSLRFNLKF